MHYIGYLHYRKNKGFAELNNFYLFIFGFEFSSNLAVSGGHFQFGTQGIAHSRAGDQI